ncbi:MAG: DNA repair protein RecN (Recombination protein N) [Alphaproteobacteria bacterium]|jgi:DNA repair protein RecN (Recombination protein N)
MLARLSIRDVVLIERLDLVFHGSLSVLTGETGAGKSILLDALGLTLGDRGQAGLIRAGAERAQVTAEFDLTPDHPALTFLAEHDIEAEPPLILRRALSADGRSRAYVNDQPVSIGLLAELGGLLVEIHGQHETRGLLNPASHRALLDAAGGHGKLVADVAVAHDAMRATEQAEIEARTALEIARRDQEFLRHAVDELDSFAPETGEEERLATERRFLMAGAKLTEALDTAARELSDATDVEGALNRALRAIDRHRDEAAGRFDVAIAALSRAVAESADAIAEIHAAGNALSSDSGRLDQAEERLFALRALARKHDVTADALAVHAESLRAKLAAIDDSDAAMKRLTAATLKARAAYEKAAKALTQARTKAARALDTAIAKELPPLKLEKAVFGTKLEPLNEEAWGPSGAERVHFEIAANPGSPPGPLHRVASGGELARIMLALRVVLAGDSAVPTLVFDEVDAGISGATAAAVGERLARLGSEVQVLVVTHSPQVAARGVQHLRVEKLSANEATVTSVAELEPSQRREEIARMLAGARITDEARAAADKLLAGGS